MKKFLKLAIPAIAMVAVATGTWTKVHHNSEPTSELEIKNIEAITNSEFNPMQSCAIYCRTYVGYVCILRTNYDFDIYCDDMVTWSFI